MMFLIHSQCNKDWTIQIHFFLFFNIVHFIAVLNNYTSDDLKVVHLYTTILASWQTQYGRLGWNCELNSYLNANKYNIIV